MSGTIGARTDDRGFLIRSLETIAEFPRSKPEIIPV